MQVNLLDDAIKLLIVKDSLFVKYSYSRAELLHLKETIDLTIPPIFLDDRLFKKKMGKLRSIKVEKSDITSNTRNLLSFESVDNGRDPNKLPNVYSPPILSRIPLQKKYQRGVGDRRQDVRQSWEYNNYSTKPEWYTEGPLNADEQVEFENIIIPFRNEKSSGTVEEIDPSIKEKIDIKHDDLPIIKANENSACELDAEKQNSPSRSHREKPTKIHTLREIELDLRVRHHESENNNDLSAYYKLLELVGIHTEQRSTSNTNRTQFPYVNNKSHQNSGDDERVNEFIPNLSSSTDKSEIITPKENMAMSIETMTIARELNANSPSQVPLHVLNHGNFGQNTFRWIRAMTNAASASQFICRKIDPSGKFDINGSQDNEEYLTNSDNVDPEQYYDPSLFYNPVGFPLGGRVNRMVNRFLPPFSLYNPNKYFARPHLQPHVLQQILQQQHLAKYGYLTEPALNLLNWRNAQNAVPNCAPMVSENHFTNTNCSSSTSYSNGEATDMCAPLAMPYQNPADYSYDDNTFMPAA